MILFPILNLYILTSSYLFIKRWGTESLSEIILSVFVLYTAQITITQTILGILGLLTVKYLTITNLLISSIFLYFSLDKSVNRLPVFSKDLKKLTNWINTVYTPYNFFLTCLLILLSVWIILAAYLLPARGIDDITYHLTTLIEFIKHEKIFVLPLDYRPHFTMPLNAELLFLWPTIFYKNDYAFGLVQYIAGLFAVIAIYRFCILLSAEKKVSFFAAQLFIFSPVVMAQSGSGYIDLIFSVFFLLSLYYSVRYYQDRKDYYLYLAALTIGLLAGMKYTALLLVLLLQVLIINSELLKNKGKLSLYCLIILLSGGYWYLRNLLEFGSFTPFLSDILHSDDSKVFFRQDIYDLYSTFTEKTRELFLYDTGIDSLNGGFGIIFWGIALPSTVYFLIISIKTTGKRKLIPIYIWLQIIPGLLLLYISPLSRLYFRPRYSIFIIAIALIALAKMIQKFRNYRLYRNVIIIICCFFSLLSLIHLSKLTIPSYRIDPALNDKISSGHDFSKLRYHLLSKTSMSYIWETLDYITMHYDDGLSVYISMTDKDFSTPVYGSAFNNSIWNFEKEKTRLPDAFIFRLSKSQKVKNYGNHFTFHDVLKSSLYTLIDMSDNSYLFLHNKFFEDHNPVFKSLMKHYEHYYSNDIKIIKNIAYKLDKSIPVVCPNYLGFIFTYLKEINIGINEVYTVPPEYENELIKHIKLRKFYTVGFIPDGFKTKKVDTIRIENKEIYIYENTLEKI